MEPHEIASLAGQLQADDPQQQQEAVWHLARSADPQALAIVFAMLGEDGPYAAALIESASEGLLDGAPATIAPTLRHFNSAPLSSLGKRCAGVLGEIAYRQGSARDATIVVSLLDALARAVPHGTREIAALVAALRECARSGGIPQASAALRAVLQQCRLEQDPYLFCIDNALDILYINEGEAFLAEVRKTLRDAGAPTGLAEAMTYFIERNRTE